MAITATITTSTGIPIIAIPGDRISEEITGTVFPSCYGAEPISFDCQFSFFQDPVTYPVVQVTLTNTLTNYGVNVEILNSNTVRVTATIINLFDGENWQFLLKNNTVQTLSPNTTEDFVSLISWSMPNSVYQDLFYDFEFKYETDPITTITVLTTITQAVFWSYNNSLNQFQTLLSQGEA